LSIGFSWFARPHPPLFDFTEVQNNLVKVSALPAGVHSFSNGKFNDESWPKVRWLRKHLKKELDKGTRVRKNLESLLPTTLSASRSLLSPFCLSPSNNPPYLLPPT
jgi:uncharacterized protein with NRDE domain